MPDDSLWKSCKTCGKKIAVDAKICPQCGSRNGNKGWVKWIIGGFAALVLLSSIIKEDDKAATAVSDTTESALQLLEGNVKSSVPSVDVPKSQLSFIDVVEGYSSQFSGAKNELQQSVLRDKRRASITDIFDAGLSVENWVGTIARLETNTEGKAILSIEISPNIVLKTWNNGLSDLVHNTLIEKSSPSYSALLDLAVGDNIAFSGSFFPSNEDGVYETSVTISGSMQDPEFLFKFNKVEKK